MGKGSSPRPFSVSKEEFDNNFDRIFRNKNFLEKSVESNTTQDEKDENQYSDDLNEGFESDRDFN